MKKQDIIKIYNAINPESKIYVLRGLSGIKFSYAVNKNLAILKKEVDLYNGLLAPTDEYLKFEEARVELLKTKYAKKDGNGNPMTVNTGEGETYVIENREEWDLALEELRKEHKEAIDAREKQVKDLNEMLQEDTAIELHKISYSDVPQNITPEQMNAIFEFVTE